MPFREQTVRAASSTYRKNLAKLARPIDDERRRRIVLAKSAIDALSRDPSRIGNFLSVLSEVPPTTSTDFFGRMEEIFGASGVSFFYAGGMVSAGPTTKRFTIEPPVPLDVHLSPLVYNRGGSIVQYAPAVGAANNLGQRPATVAIDLAVALEQAVFTINAVRFGQPEQFVSQFLTAAEFNRGMSEQNIRKKFDSIRQLRSDAAEPFANSLGFSSTPSASYGRVLYGRANVWCVDQTHQEGATEHTFNLLQMIVGSSLIGSYATHLHALRKIGPNVSLSQASAIMEEESWFINTLSTLVDLAYGHTAFRLVSLAGRMLSYLGQSELTSVYLFEQAYDPLVRLLAVDPNRPVELFDRTLDDVSRAAKVVLDTISIEAYGRPFEEVFPGAAASLVQIKSMELVQRQDLPIIIGVWAENKKRN